MLFASSNSHRLVLFAVIYYLLSLNGTYALPLHRRQNNGATTVTTTRTTQTNAGPVTETCEITLTPITDKDGKPAVEEVKKCTLALANGGTAAGSSTTFISTATATSAASTSTDTVTLTSATATSTSTDTATTSDTASLSLTTTIATSTPPGGATVTATTSQATSTGSGTSSAVPGVSSGKAGAIIANGISTVSRSAAATGTTPAATTTSPTQPEATGGTPSDSNNNPNGTSAADSTVSASAAAASSTDGFQLPGKKLSVLPIGLGVFAGISVIALIVVGLVTYERTKYRKAFRQRKLAESGASMGYGGTAA